MRVKGGIDKNARRSANKSRIRNPLSAIILSPADARPKKPLFAVIYLSEVLPPHKSEIKSNAPDGDILTTHLQVLCDLYEWHVFACDVGFLGF